MDFGKKLETQEMYMRGKILFANNLTARLYLIEMQWQKTFVDGAGVTYRQFITNAIWQNILMNDQTHLQISCKFATI